MLKRERIEELISSKRVEEKSNRVESVKPEEQQGGDGSKKVKVKRKRVGITVIKKADIKKPRIRIVKETKRDDEVKIKRVESKKDSDKSKISKELKQKPSPKRRPKRVAKAKDSG